MSFAKPSKVSRSRINKAGKTLKKEIINSDFESAVKLADNWRACHAYPINTFQSTLRTKLRKYQNEPIVAQRLKRMPTIIDKLQRYPNMQLTTMQDIGGIRAILGSIEDVYKLAKDYRENKRLPHELYNENNHIQTPRNEDGYRSLHLMYKYRNPQAKEYDGLRVELQIRTKTQHIWATAVETMGTFLGQALKSRQGDKDWLDFFATVSSAFACIEKTPVLPRHQNMTKLEIFKAVANTEKKLGALEKMNAFYKAADEITGKRKSEGSSYHLIILNSLEKTVEVKPYSRDEFKKAVADYAQIEAEAVKGKKIEPVLVSAGPLSTLKRAYPNFFLDISEFCKAVAEIVDKTKK
ncbi:MAG: RelA/SpoT domain-containing protein [Candidatus Kerfeldbacteria bacterium]|nr:RelA/SpoT domain-containing protein [Candidatus Kerfeldbacteria bacterium]